MRVITLRNINRNFAETVRYSGTAKVVRNTVPSLGDLEMWYKVDEGLTHYCYVNVTVHVHETHIPPIPHPTDAGRPALFTFRPHSGPIQSGII